MIRRTAITSLIVLLFFSCKTYGADKLPTVTTDTPFKEAKAIFEKYKFRKWDVGSWMDPPEGQKRSIYQIDRNLYIVTIYDVKKDEIKHIALLAQPDYRPSKQVDVYKTLKAISFDDNNTYQLKFAIPTTEDKEPLKDDGDDLKGLGPRTPDSTK